MSEDERIEEGIEINSDLELEGYRTYNRLQIWMTIMCGLVALGIVASVTFLTWHFNKPTLMWFLILSVLIYDLG